MKQPLIAKHKEKFVLITSACTKREINSQQTFFNKYNMHKREIPNESNISHVDMETSFFFEKGDIFLRMFASFFRYLECFF